jgi:hypothetical protein
VFVELPKYRETSPREARKVRWAWLKFLKEAGSAGSRGHPTPEEFRAEVGVSEPLRQALAIAEQCGLDPAQLEHYDRFWDMVSTERTLFGAARDEALAEGREEGRAEGREEGERIGIEKGERIGIEKGERIGIEKKQLEIAAALKEKGLLADREIADITGLTVERVAAL